MAKRLTAIDRAVADLEAKRADLTLKYEAEQAGLDAAIAALRSQPARKARTAKPKVMQA